MVALKLEAMALRIQRAARSRNAVVALKPGIRAISCHASTRKQERRGGIETAILAVVARAGGVGSRNAVVALKPSQVSTSFALGAAKQERRGGIETSRMRSSSS